VTPAADDNASLADQVAEFYADPLGFVLFAYPWGEVGTALEHFDGPDQWQRELLEEIGRDVLARQFDGVNSVEAIREAIASGHGIGKSVLVAWLVNWIMSTRPGAQGTVTANTVTQLETKTWAAIDKWTSLCITRHWFKVSTGAIRIVEGLFEGYGPRNWFCVAQTCREENSEAFAGQHAATSTSFYIFDEASAVPDKIFEVAEGGLTDGEPHIYAFGNPTRNSGKFYRVCFGAEQERWKHRSIDSRLARMTNKATIAEWLQDYGEDSDFFRVRVRGLPPGASELQFIDRNRVLEAQARNVETLADEPLVCGMDVSGGGSAWNVIRFRRGLDARSIPAKRINGEQGRDRNVLVGIAAEIMRDRTPGRQVAALFIDSAFGSPIFERLRSLGFNNVFEVSFGAKSGDPHQANMRAFMWFRLKDWLLRGAIPKDEAIGEPDRSHTISGQLCGPGYHINRQNKLVLESKSDMQKRGEASPDDADALALTFAAAVAPKPKVTIHEEEYSWQA
jgi:hypothetical protein